MDKQTFISQIATYVKKYASSYGIMVHSPVIAQAILESGWGESPLASKYHNYFGLKCGGAWKGKSVNMTTSEEYIPGTHTIINDNFRVFDSMEEGVKGYFDFINYSRYANLKGVTDPQTYVENIKADGYATSSTYVKNLMRVINDNNLTQYDNDNANTVKDTQSIDEIVQAVIAGKYGNGEDRKNALEAAGYNYTEIQNKVNEFYGVSTAPTPTPTKTVDELAQEVISGKWGNGLDRKAALEAAGYDYSSVQAKVNELCGTSAAHSKSIEELAKEVWLGKWGNGQERIDRLTAAGYDAVAVQKKVNHPND